MKDEKLGLMKFMVTKNWGDPNDNTERNRKN